MATFSGELRGRPPELLRKSRHLRVQNQRVLSDLHAWAVRTKRSVSNKNRLLICSGYMYLYIACMIFNRLMSAMSIDGIWQNNLIYFEIRRNAASRFGIRIPYPCWLTAFSHQNAK